MSATTATTIAAPLTRLDRCDRCSAAAQVRALFPAGSELLFCAHHARAHTAGLAGRARLADVDGRELAA